MAASIPHRAAAPPGTHGLLVEDSRFVLSGGRGRAVVAANQTGVTLRNLDIAVEDGRDPAGMIELRGCAGIDRDATTRPRPPRFGDNGHPPVPLAFPFPPVYP